MEGRLKIKIFNREICVCALLATNSFMCKKQRRNGENDDQSIGRGMEDHEQTMGERREYDHRADGEAMVGLDSKMA